jgi:hypothetical protein
MQKVTVTYRHNQIIFEDTHGVIVEMSPIQVANKAGFFAQCVSFAAMQNADGLRQLAGWKKSTSYEVKFMEHETIEPVFQETLHNTDLAAAMNCGKWMFAEYIKKQPYGRFQFTHGGQIVDDNVYVMFLIDQNNHQHGYFDVVRTEQWIKVE